MFCFLPFTSYAANNLVVGTLSNDPPFGFINKGTNLTGFDIDIMQAICKSIKRKCTFKIYPFSQLLAALEQGEIDLVIGALIITPEREKRFLFSIPYKISQYQYLTLAASTLSTVSQLHGKVLGVYNSAPDKQKVYKQLKENVTLKFYGDLDQMLAALRSKNVDAILVEHSRAIYWVANAAEFKLLGLPVPNGEGYGIAAKKDRAHLIHKINRAIKTLEQEGTYLKIYQLYF
jgi:ABC-type amino acid transport substrate-binding protein